MSRAASKTDWVRWRFPLAFAVLITGIALSLHFFPGPFDWRYRVVSSLNSRVDNPQGNIYFCAALALTFGILFPLPRYLRDRLESSSPRATRFAFHALRVGFAGGIVVGFERLFFRNLSDQIHKAHEYIALVAFFGLFFGVVTFWYALSQWWRERHPQASTRLAGLFLISYGPMAGACLSQAYLYFVPNDLGWVGPHWAALGVPLYLSFAFWEWLASAGIFVYLYCLLLLLPAETRSNKTSPIAHPKAS